MNTATNTLMMAGAVAIGLLQCAAAQDTSGATAQKKPSWTDNVKLGADARVRYQVTDEEGKESRERWRFRGRVALEGKVNDQVKANLRLVTNTGDPISDNQTMDNAFDDKNAAFDRVFMTYTPDENLTLRAGKMPQPWIAVDDLVFSGDVNPEGAAANYELGSEKVKLMLHGGAFVVDERSSDDETMLFTGQAATRFNLGKKDFVMVGASIYAYSNCEGYGLQGPDETKSQGNSTIAETSEDEETLLYATDYTVIEGFVSAALDVGVPLTLGAQYMVNTEADDFDTGYLFSASVKLSPSIDIGYQYRYLEKDSTLGLFAENTDFGNGTDIEGHIPYIKFKLGKNVDAKVQYAMGQKGLDSGKDIDTFKIDLACKF